MSYSPWGHKESEMIERLKHTHIHTVHGVTKSQR